MCGSVYYRLKRVSLKSIDWHHFPQCDCIGDGAYQEQLRLDGVIW